MSFKVQQYKLATLQLRKLPTWDGDWARMDSEHTQLIGRRWRCFEAMTWSEQAQIRDWERARKVAIA